MKNKIKHISTVTIHPYSLVEMLVVIAIIAILAGIGAGGYAVGRRWLSQSRTEALLAKIKIAIESYKNDKGYYPLPHTDPSETDIRQIPCFRLDTNAKDFTSGSHSGSELQIRNNMNSFIDYSKIQQDQSLKILDSGCNYYYVKDGWNTPVIAAHRATLIDGSTHEFGEIKYRCPGLINKTSFDLYSAGYDREFGTEDDIYVKF